MQSWLQRFSLCASLILLAAALSAGASLDAGKRAYEQQEYATAFKEFMPLAQQGNAEAEFLLGRMYLMGRGVLQDQVEADRLFRASAAQGNADAEFFLGAPSVLRHENVAEGLKWLRLSAEQGNQDAQLLLGKTYLDGLASELPRDAAQAEMWLWLAAKGNLPFYENELRAAEQQMNAADIAKGRALAEAWKPKHEVRRSDIANSKDKPKS
jgi:TPR repeat protein